MKNYIRIQKSDQRLNTEDIKNILLAGKKIVANTRQGPEIILAEYEDLNCLYNAYGKLMKWMELKPSKTFGKHDWEEAS